MTSLLIADFIQGVLLFIFILATCYTLLFGKKGTGIKKDYAICMILLIFIIWRFSRWGIVIKI